MQTDPLKKVVVLDLEMPIMDGVEAAKAIRAHTSGAGTYLMC